MATNPMNPQGMYSPTNTSTYVPPKKKTTTNNIPGMGSKTLINVQQGLVAPAKGTIPGISNTNVLTGVQSAIKPTTKKDETLVKPKKAHEAIVGKKAKEFADFLSKIASGTLKTIGASQIKSTIFGDKPITTGTIIDYIENNPDVVKTLQNSDIVKNNPAVASVFANYLKKAGIEPLTTPTETIPKPLPEVPSTITTPGLGDSQALIEAQSEIKPEKEKPPVKVDVDKEKNKPAKDKADEITGGAEQITKEDSDKIKNDLNNQKEDALDKATTPEQKNDIMKYFNKLQKEITRRTISQLKAGKEQALISLGQAQAALTPQYESQRARAATTSMQQARNFGEYLAARGQATSGLAAQAELTRGAGLTRQLGEIGQQQQAAQDQLNANKAKIQSDFQLAVANAKSNAEIAKLNEQFRQAIKQEDRAYAEKIYQQQLQDRLNEIKSGREWQLAFAKYQNAVNRGNTIQAQNFQKEMFDLENQATKDLISFKASFEPTPTPDTSKDYLTNPDYQDAYNQVTSGKFVEEFFDGSVNRQRVVQKTPEEVLQIVIANKINFINQFGEEAYKTLYDSAKALIPKSSIAGYVDSTLNTNQ